MWESLIIELLGKVLLPELIEYTKRKFESTGEWPTVEELEKLVSDKADQIIIEGREFLNRPAANSPEGEK